MGLITKLKGLFKRNDPPFMVAKKPPVNWSDTERFDVQFICPISACGVYWADAVIYLGAPISPENLKVREVFKSIATIDGSKPISCPACGHIYTLKEKYDLIEAARIGKQIAGIDDTIVEEFHERLSRSEGETAAPESEDPNTRTSY